MIRPVDPSIMLDAVLGAFGRQSARSVGRKTVDNCDVDSLRPILAMTAGAATEDKERAKQAGMNDHVATVLLESTESGLHQVISALSVISPRRPCAAQTHLPPPRL